MILRPGVYSLRLAFADGFHCPLWKGEPRVAVDGSIEPDKLTQLGLVDLPFEWTWRPGS